MILRRGNLNIPPLWTRHTYLWYILPTKYSISNAIRIYGFYLLINSDVSATSIVVLIWIQYGGAGLNRSSGIIDNAFKTEQHGVKTLFEFH